MDNEQSIEEAEIAEITTDNDNSPIQLDEEDILATENEAQDSY